jgi:hypothetical protein
MRGQLLGGAESKEFHDFLTILYIITFLGISYDKPKWTEFFILVYSIYIYVLINTLFKKDKYINKNHIMASGYVMIIVILVVVILSYCCYLSTSNTNIGTTSRCPKKNTNNIHNEQGGSILPRRETGIKDIVANIIAHKPSYLTPAQYSLLMQTEFRAYNPGCFYYQGKLFLVLRVCNLNRCSQGHGTWHDDFSSTLVVYCVDTGRFLVVDISPSSSFVLRRGPEDAKCIVHDGTLYMFCTHFNAKGVLRMCVLHTPVADLAKDLLISTMTRVEEKTSEKGQQRHSKIAHYFSASTLTVDNMPLQPIEKNWMPVVVRGQLHLIYSLEPFVLLRLGANNSNNNNNKNNGGTWTCTKVHESRSGWLGWDDLRGTSNVVDYAGGKVCVAHYNNDGDYQHCFVRLREPQSDKKDKKSTNNQKVNPKPLEPVDKSVMFKVNGAKVEFINGLAVDKDNNLVLTYGVNDCTPNMVRISPRMFSSLFDTRKEGHVQLFSGAATKSILS